MTLVVACFAVGVLLLALEIIVPGAVLGIAGGIAMTIGVVAAFSIFGGAGGAMATLIAMLALGLTVYLEFVWLPKSRFAKRFTMDATLDATSQPAVADAQAVVGREAVAQTVLAPSGFVKVDGRRYEAFCQGGHAPAGAALRVVGLDNFRLIVTKN